MRVSNKLKAQTQVDPTAQPPIKPATTEPAKAIEVERSGGVDDGLNADGEQALEDSHQKISESLQRLGSKPVDAQSARGALLGRPLELPGEGLNAPQRQALLAFGLGDKQIEAFASGQAVAFEIPSAAGQATIGTLQLAKDRVKSTCISVHDEKSGFRTLMNFRDSSRELARAFGKEHYELGGAAVINAKLEKMLIRGGFAKGSVPVPDDLGNDGDMDVYQRLFDA